VAPALRLLAALAGAGLVLGVFSEFVFFNEAPAQAVLGAGGVAAMAAASLSVWPFYAALALVFSAALSAAGRADWPALALAGALYGWAAEAVFVAQVHEAPPVSLAWPALGWHMPVDAALGCFLLPAALRRGPGAALAAGLGCGVLWGVWTSWTWADGLRLAPATFAAYAAATALPALAGLALLARFGPALWQMPRGLRRAVAAAAAGLAVLTGAGQWPSLAALAAVAALAAAGLMRLGRRRPDAPPPAGDGRAAARAALLAAMPAAASGSHALLHAAGGAPPMQEAIFFLFVAGTCIFFAAIWRAFTSD
jgi:hypothetical protein